MYGNNSYALKPDDILVIRGTGKFIYKGCGNETRKGRVYVRLQNTCDIPCLYTVLLYYFIILLLLVLIFVQTLCANACCRCCRRCHQQQTGPDICSISSLHRCICFLTAVLAFSVCKPLFCAVPAALSPADCSCLFPVFCDESALLFSCCPLF